MMIFYNDSVFHANAHYAACGTIRYWFRLLERIQPSLNEPILYQSC
jgi:hypothetical protein